VRKLLVAVSGGADSTALALLFDDFAKSQTGGAPEIVLGHVHHAIRAGEADDDETFVRDLGKKLDLPVLVARVSVPSLMEEEGLSTEVAARRLRYDAFRQWADEFDLQAIALAHHREDQQETVLLRVARGTGLKGLAGMPPDRALEGCLRTVRLIRPLLEWARADLEDFLEARGQEYRNDSTNTCLDYPRNRVRHEVLPRLETVHPGVRRSLERLSRQARRLSEDLETLATRVLKEVSCSQQEGAVQLQAEALRRWPATVLREVLVRAVSLLEPTRPPPSERAFAAFEGLVCGEETRSADLGAGLSAELRYGTVSVYQTSGDEAAARRADGDDDRDHAVKLHVGGNPVSFGPWLIGADPSGEPRFSRDPLEEWVDAALVGTELTVRSRREGDAFQPLGSPGKKKLKEFFRERRIPPRLRDACPLVVLGEDIVWVVGERLADPFRVRPESRTTVRLHAVRSVVTHHS